MPTVEERVVRSWIIALEEAWQLAYGERKNQLDGRYVKTFDSRGLHPYSHQWGVIAACEVLVPELIYIRTGQYGGPECNWITLRREAYAQAEEDWINGKLEEVKRG